MNKNQKGSILIAVSMLSLVMVIIAIGIVTLSSSQSLSNRHQIERIKAEQVVKGAFWYNYMSLITNNTPDMPDDEILDNKKFVPTLAAPTSGPNGTTAYDIVVDYNLPQ